MTGRTVEYVFPPKPGTHGPDERPVLLEIEHLSRPGEFEDVSLTVRAGEIVGLAGLVGSGRSEILETVYGARRPASGRISVAGTALRPGSITSAVRAGLGLAPEERKSQALFLHSSIAHNVSVSALRRFAHAGFMDARTELEATTEAVRGLDLRPPDPTRPVRTLSGGNQQKAVVARWLLTDCRLLLLDEPTRGVDVGARAELYTLIRGLADAGVGVLLVSSEVPEVLGLADRVLVLREGRVVREAGAQDLDESIVLDLVMEGSSA
jgi:ribose transport system ATP-binding protein